jgi:hypothetical protein
MSEQDPFVLRAPNGTLFSYGNAGAAHKIDVDARQLEFDEIEFARTEPLPNPATLTVGDMIKVFTVLSSAPPDWRKQPAIGQMLLRREMLLSASPGWRAFEKWVQRKHGCYVTIKIAQDFRGELCRLLGKDFDAIEALPLLESAHQLEHSETARPPAPPREDEQAAAAPASGNVALEPAPPKYSLPGGQWLMVVPDDPPPYEIPVEGLDGRCQVIQMGAKPLKFGHMIVLLDDLKVLLDRFRETPTSATQNDINRSLGLLWSDPGFERFRNWANIEFGRDADADAAHELKKRLSTKLRISFDTLDKMPVVEVMRLVDEHSADSPASQNVTPETPKRKPAADASPEQKAEFNVAMNASAEIAIALRGRPDAVKLWADAADRLTLGFKKLATVRDDETRRLIFDETYVLIARDWHAMAALTPEVDFATGNRGAVTGCFQVIDEAMRKLAVRPDGNQLWSAWYAAHNTIAQANLFATAFSAAIAAVTSKPAAAEGSGTAAQIRPVTAGDLLEAKAQWPSPANSPAPPLESEQPGAAPGLGSKTKSSSSTQRKRTRRPKRISKVQAALVILKYRASKERESIRIEDIAAEAACSPQNLYKSPEFKKEWGSARARRFKRGWKLDGVADCPDESTLDVG